MYWGQSETLLIPKIPDNLLLIYFRIPSVWVKVKFQLKPNSAFLLPDEDESLRRVLVVNNHLIVHQFVFIFETCALFQYSVKENITRKTHPVCRRDSSSKKWVHTAFNKILHSLFLNIVQFINLFTDKYSCWSNNSPRHLFYVACFCI